MLHARRPGPVATRHCDGRRPRTPRIAVAALAGLALACGSLDPGATRSSAAVRSGAGSLVVAAPANGAPRIVSLTVHPSTPTGGEAVRVVATVRDPEGDPISLRFEWTVAGERLAEHGAEVVLPPLPEGAWLVVRAVASDGRARSEPVEVRVRLGSAAFPGQREAGAGPPAVGPGEPASQPGPASPQGAP